MNRFICFMYSFLALALVVVSVVGLLLHMSDLRYFLIFSGILATGIIGFKHSVKVFVSRVPYSRQLIQQEACATLDEDSLDTKHLKVGDINPMSGRIISTCDSFTFSTFSDRD